MISHHYNESGALILSALVHEPNTPFTFYEHLTFYFHEGTLAEAKQEFRQYLADKGMTLVK